MGARAGPSIGTQAAADLKWETLPMATPRELEAMDLALTLAARGLGTASPNPVVGCVLVGADGTVVGSGWHERAGLAHAEALALAEAGSAARGATAVVTLEPCAHTGRTGPCATALIDAGVVRVVFAAADPGSISGGGAEVLRAAGVDVEGAVLVSESESINHAWFTAQRLGRPFVTVKMATSLDGRIAAVDGSSRWITGPAARADAHRRRAMVDAVIVGTGTLRMDDPELSVRDVADDIAFDAPLRVVMGRTEVPSQARVRGNGEGFVHLSTHDVDAALAQLWELDVRSVLVEGGPTLTTAFLRHGVVDEVVAYVAPVLIGSGGHAIGDLGGVSIDDASRLNVVSIDRLGDDVLMVGRFDGTTGHAPVAGGA